MSLSQLLVDNNHNIKLGLNLVKIGANTTAGTDSTVLGVGADGSGNESVSVGWQSAALGAQGVAVGAQSEADGAGAVALGPNASAPAAGDISIGSTAGVTDTAGTGVIRLASVPVPATIADKPADRHVPVTINGTVYYLLASTV